MTIRALLKRIPTTLILPAVALAVLLSAGISFGQTRRVFVNGIRMSDKQVQQLEYYACTPIPNGMYWLNLFNGAWGYMGNMRVQGHFGDQCRNPGNAQAYQRRKSLSERGMLYSPGEILSGR